MSEIGVPYVRVKAVIDTLTEACEKGEITADDLVIGAGILEESVEVNAEIIPADSIKFRIYHVDPKAHHDTELFIFRIKEKNEE